MSLSINIHQCTTIRIRSHHPNNGNCIGLVILADGHDIEFNLFDLPRNVTTKLLLALADEETEIDENVGK